MMSSAGGLWVGELGESGAQQSVVDTGQEQCMVQANVQESSQIVTRLDQARVDKILAEHDPFLRP